MAAGKRQFTRDQRTQIATLLIQSAKASSPGTTGTSSAAKGQLAHGLSLLTDGKHDNKTVLNITGLGDALKDQTTTNAHTLATAWELEIWPQPVPANKKTKTPTEAELVGAEA